MISTSLLIVLILTLLFLSAKLLFWPHNKTWEALFNAGQAPESFTKSDGGSQEWSIRMVTGPIPSLNFWPFNHRKCFYSVCNVSKWGYNILFKNFRWGSFYAGDKDNGSALLDYSVHMNSFFTNKIHDFVRTTPNPDVMIGKFYYKILGKYRFLGYFTMTRVKED